MSDYASRVPAASRVSLSLSLSLAFISFHPDCTIYSISLDTLICSTTGICPHEA